MLEKEEMRIISTKTYLEQIKSATSDKDEEWFVVSITVENPMDRTLYAYGSVRRLFYDNNTRKLTLYLHDQHLTADEEKTVSPHLKQPRFVPLEADAKTDIKLTIPPVYNRVRTAAERGGSGPMVEVLRVAEATEIKIEIACQDTPFYYNPKMENARQFKEWGNVISKADFKVEPAVKDNTVEKEKKKTEGKKDNKGKKGK